jgi:hypothetical protein
MAESPKKPPKSPQRYDRLLKGEISAKQYVKSLQQEARARRSAQSSSYASRRAGSA